MGCKRYKEWGRLHDAEDVAKNKGKCCCDCNCDCGCNCGCDCNNHQGGDCCEKEENPKEECHKDKKVVFVFNTCIGEGVTIKDNFRDILKDNDHSFNENFKETFKEAFKDAFQNFAIVKDNPIDVLSNNCVDIMFDSVREILNETFKDALKESLNGINSDDNSHKPCIKVSDNFKDNFSCNKDILPIANQENKSSSCAKSEGFFSAAGAINTAGIDDCDPEEFGGGFILDSLETGVDSLEDKE